jgi:NTP pyrophosphatase (non-canonical NTP hydrolase)
MIQSEQYSDMLAAVRAFHDKHDFKSTGGEELMYRVALMTEELGEIAECITKGRDKQELAEEVADLFILLIGTAIAADFDLKQAFWEKMDKIMRRESKIINGRIRVSEFRDK